MAERFPDAHRQLSEIADSLEHHYRNMQDLEFTVEHGTLWLLQTRNGKRTAEAEVRIAVEMVEEGLLGQGGGRAPGEPRAGGLLSPSSIR